VDGPRSNSDGFSSQRLREVLRGGVLGEGILPSTLSCSMRHTIGGPNGPARPCAHGLRRRMQRNRRNVSSLTCAAVSAAEDKGKEAIKAEWGKRLFSARYRKMERQIALNSPPDVAQVASKRSPDLKGPIFSSKCLPCASRITGALGGTEMEDGGNILYRNTVKSGQSSSTSRRRSPRSSSLAS